MRVSCYSQSKWDETSIYLVSQVIVYDISERLDFGAGQRGSDNRGWTVAIYFLK